MASIFLSLLLIFKDDSGRLGPHYLFEVVLQQIFIPFDAETVSIVSDSASTDVQT